MARYHYNPDTGQVGVCRADPSKPNSRGCKFKLTEGEHFQSSEEAAKAYESTQDPFAKTKDSKGRELTNQQERYFEQSAVRDEQGQLLEVHHGSSVDFNEFDLSKVGKGEDTWGNGFYFTTEKSLADSYSNGGKSKDFYLAINNPFFIDGKNETSLNNLQLTPEQNKAIVLAHPDLQLLPDEDEDRRNPLEDYSADYWDLEGPDPKSLTPAERRAKAQKMRKIAEEVFEENFTNASWVELEVFYGRENGAAMLEAAHKATGRDGVIVDFGEGVKHFVAWKPEQIKLSSNKNPSDTVHVGE